MTQSNEAYSPQRHATRAPVQRGVRVYFEKLGETVEGECRNISIGGMFVAGRAADAPGSAVRFELALEDGSAIRGAAEMMWARSTDAGPGKEPGFGLKFKHLEQRDRQMIFKLVSRHIKDRLADRHAASAAEPEPDRSGLVVPPVVARPEAPQPAAPQPGAPQPAAPDSASSVLPDDWDDDPTAFNVPVASLTDAPDAEEESSSGGDPSGAGSSGAGSSDAGSSGAGSSDGVTPGFSPSSFESDAGSLSEVFMQSDFSLDLPLDPSADSEPDLPLGDRSRSTEPSDPYLQHLGEDHFDHRPVPKRDLPILPVAALALVLAAALGYLFSDQIFDWVEAGNDSPAVPAQPQREAEPGAVYEPSGAETGAETETPSAPPPQPGAPQPGAPQPGASPPQAAAPPPPAPPPPRAEPTPRQGGAFRALEDVTWKSSGRGLTLTLTVDGTAEQRRIDHFRLEGDSVREVIRLLGMREKADLSALTVGQGGVQRIRFGWHKKSRGNEIHLVLDMADTGARVTDVRAEGQRFLVEITR